MTPEEQKNCPYCHYNCNEPGGRRKLNIDFPGIADTDFFNQADGIVDFGNITADIVDIGEENGGGYVLEVHLQSPCVPGKFDKSRMQGLTLWSERIHRCPKCGRDLDVEPVQTYDDVVRHD